MSEPCVPVMQAVEAFLKQHAKTCSRILIGFSGGIDSSVLLDALATAIPDRSRLHAIHVNHGLSEHAGNWNAHCAAFCEHLAVPYSVETVEVDPADKRGVEAAARETRYAVFKRFIQEDEILLLAHHQSDQAETMLLQLARGSGVAGLAAMPAETVFAAGIMIRPFLGLPQAAVSDYAQAKGLTWIEDDSNAELRFDRNFVRHQVIPVLQQRWPSIEATIARSAAHCADANQLVKEYATALMQRLAEGEGLSIPALLELDDAACRAVIRQWLSVLGLSCPSSVKIRRIVDELLRARPDANPLVNWHDVEVRRYRDVMYAMNSLPPTPDEQRRWNMDKQLLSLTVKGLGRFALQNISGIGLSRQRVRSARTIELRFAQKGLRCAIDKCRTRGLGELFQLAAVPPWLRPFVPLLFIDEQLAMIGQFRICENWQSRGGDDALGILMAYEHPLMQQMLVPHRGNTERGTG